VPSALSVVADILTHGLCRNNAAVLSASMYGVDLVDQAIGATLAACAFNGRNFVLGRCTS
jgi:hypothetical protein